MHARGCLPGAVLGAMCVGTTSASSGSPPAPDTEMNQDSHQEFLHRHQRNDKAKGSETTQRASDQESAPARSLAAVGAGRHDTHRFALTVFLCIYRGLFRKQRFRSCFSTRPNRDTCQGKVSSSQQGNSGTASPCTWENANI